MGTRGCPARVPAGGLLVALLALGVRGRLPTSPLDPLGAPGAELGGSAGACPWRREAGPQRTAQVRRAASQPRPRAHWAGLAGSAPAPGRPLSLCQRKGRKEPRGCAGGFTGALCVQTWKTRGRHGRRLWWPWVSLCSGFESDPASFEGGPALWASFPDLQVGVLAVPTSFRSPSPPPATVAIQSPLTPLTSAMLNSSQNLCRIHIVFPVYSRGPSCAGRLWSPLPDPPAPALSQQSSLGVLNTQPMRHPALRGVACPPAPLHWAPASLGDLGASITSRPLAPQLCSGALASPLSLSTTGPWYALSADALCSHGISSSPGHARDRSCQVRPRLSF